MSGLTTLVIGARRDSTGVTFDEFFEGSVAEPVFERTAWDSTKIAAYIAGAEAHKITGVTPDHYKNLIRNVSAPADYGARLYVGEYAHVGRSSLRPHRPREKRN